MFDDNRIFTRFFLIASLVIGLCVSAIFLGLAVRSKTLLSEQAVSQARAHFQGIVLTRKWSAQHGGVYVIKTPGMVSNPYLENPDIKTTDGRTLTLKNPALMTREISELANEKSLFNFHITSLRPINPNNAPDPFETHSLKAFEEGQKEVVEIENKAHGARLRYMAPLYVDEPCLKCHASQGYSVGQVRGGISVSFGIDDVNKALRRNNEIITILSMVTVGLLLTTLWYFFRQMKQRLEESRALLQRMATTDMLTNIANRSSLMNRFNESFARKQRKLSQLGCLMIDVDHFKAINDQYGHPMGDSVLKELAAIISATLRPYDTFGRYGGEEFLMVLEDIDAKDLADLAERIRALIEEKLGAQVGLDRSITISLGGTLVGAEDQSIDEAIKRADDALYLAKNQGRNRVVMLGMTSADASGSA